MNEHVAEVRGMFLETLGQADEEHALDALVNDERPPTRTTAGAKRSTKAAAVPKKPVPKKPAAGKKSAVRKTGTKKPVAEKSVAKKPVSRSTAPKKPTAVKSAKIQAVE